MDHVRVVPLKVPENQTFEAVYDGNVDFLWRSVRRLGVEPRDVPDLLQEIFCVVHRRLEQFEGRSSVKTWLFGIALHVVRHHRRSMGRKAAREESVANVETLAVPTLEVGPFESMEKSETLRLLDDLLTELDDDKREVFVLANVEQMTAVEIAEVLGENLNTVYSRIRAAKREFETALARRRASATWSQP